MNPQLTNILISAAIALGYLLFTRVVSARPLLWLGLLTILALVERNHPHDPTFLRMVVICSALLIGMKGLVYAEWRSASNKLPLSRWFIFTFLWFGMDPSAFSGKRRKLNWTSHAVVGASCLTVGLMLCLAVARWTNAPLVAQFIPLSMAFHFGALRLLTAFWRMVGFPVRTLFRNPLISRGVGDFWAKRWNLSFSQMMARTVQRPIHQRLGKRPALFAVFLVSGLLHELAITVPAQSGYGLPTLYFIAHGVVVLLERPSWPLWFKRSLTLALVALPLPILFPETFTREVIDQSLNVFRIYL